MLRSGITFLAALVSFGIASDVSARQTVSVDLQSTMVPVKFSSVATGQLLGGLQTGEELFVVGQAQNGLPLAALYQMSSRSVDFVIQPPKVTARFAEVSEARGIPLRDVSFGDVVIADIDGNGDNDIVYTGRTLFDILPTGNIYGEFTGIYYNFSSSSEEPTFVLRQGAGLPALSHSRLAVADFNGDGWLDVAIGGRLQDGTTSLAVYVQDVDGSGLFDVAFRLPPLELYTLCAGDFDGDGDIDLVSGGIDRNGLPVVWLHVNIGSEMNLAFVSDDQSLPDLLFPSAAFGDIDGDGDDDILLSGGRVGPAIMRGETHLYSWNEGALSARPDIDLAGVFYGSVEFADIENDGDLDFFVHGLSDPANTTGQRMVVYRNDSGRFNVISDARGLVFGAAAWIDYDGNGRREIILAGERDNRRRIIIYEIL